MIKVRRWVEIQKILYRYNEVITQLRSEEPMQANALRKSQFQRGQKVGFVGGTGTVRNSKLEASSWTHLIEMDMGPEPEMGRIGWETTVWLFESDLNAIEHSLINHLAVA